MFSVFVSMLIKGIVCTIPLTYKNVVVNLNPYTKYTKKIALFRFSPTIKQTVGELLNYFYSASFLRFLRTINKMMPAVIATTPAIEP